MQFIKHLCFILLCFGLSQNALAQFNPVGYRNRVATNILETKVDTFSIQSVVANRKALFNAPHSFIRGRMDYTYWLQLDFENEKSNLIGSDSIYLVTGVIFKAELFFKDSVIQSIHVDYTSSKHFSKGGPNAETIPISVSNLIDGRYIYLRIQGLRGTTTLKDFAFTYNTKIGELVNQNFVSIKSIESQLTVFIFIGIAALLAILNFILFGFTKERQYLVYIFFLIFQVIYYSRASSLFGYFLFGDHYFAQVTITEMAQVAANLSYVLFVKHFLDTKILLPFLNKILLVVSGALVLFIGVDTMLLIRDPFLGYQLDIMNAQRYFMAAFALLGILYLMTFAKGKLRYFVVLGTVAYTGGALLTLFGGKLQYMIIGSAIENVIFAIGLSYKIHAISIEKIKLERETYDIKISALRAQMNPHFIFNSLNSIQHLISKNDKVNALKYLTKFSILLRQVLESSIHVHIPIKQEIELLKIYLELESMRFDHAFQYTITVDNSLDVDNMELPILLLQPYVENAISHGLLPKQDGPKEIHIFFTDYLTYVKCVIQDTGIGRKASMERKKNLKITRPSRGLELSQQRLKLINQETDLIDLITIIDSENGTTVEIKIPKS